MVALLYVLRRPARAAGAGGSTADAEAEVSPGASAPSPAVAATARASEGRPAAKEAAAAQREAYRGGPVVITSDGSLRGVANWAGMGAADREWTERRVAERNAARLQQMLSEEQALRDAFAPAASAGSAVL